MIEQDRWLANAPVAANRCGGGDRCGGGGSRLLYPVEANELFLRLTTDEAATLRSHRASTSTIGARAKRGW